MAQKMEYLIDGILPKRKLNLIAGPSGAGKTTFLFSMIKEWSAGRPFLGHESHPEPFIYIGLDRQLDEIDNRIEAAGTDPDSIPHLSILDEFISFERVVSQIPPEVKVIFLDGFFTLVPGGKYNDYHVVAAFCKKINKWCESKNLTVIGLTHATKVKQGENFLHPRHRILGSVAWGGFSSTLIFIDSADPSDLSNTKRIVEVLPRTAKDETYYYTIGDGGSFIQSDNVTVLQEEAAEPTRNIMFLGEIECDRPYPTRELIDLGELHGISRAQSMRILQKWEKKEILKKHGHGEWIKESSRGYNQPGDTRSSGSGDGPKPRG